MDTTTHECHPKDEGTKRGFPPLALTTLDSEKSLCVMDKHLALYRRYLWESKNITWVYTAHVDELLASRRDYYRACGMDEPVLNADQQREIDDLMISATLASESQVARDMWGWTIRIPMKPWGLFCGVEPEGMVCARFTALPPQAADDPVGSFAIQRVSEDAPVRQTSLIPSDTSARYLVEQYFDESEQLPARIAISEHEALMALSMPDADWDVVKTLDGAQLLSLFHELCRETPATDETSAPDTTPLSDSAQRLREQFRAAHATTGMTGDLKVMHEAVFFYGCRCSHERISQMIDHLPEAQKKELWGDSKHLEIQCPRCGRDYILDKK